MLSTHEFQSTMTFLLGFVKKDKQGDALVERLLNRLGLAKSAVQRHNLAFCIAQLPITEKGVKKMAELVRVYKDCLHDDEVYEHFYTAVNKGKKAAPKRAKKAKDWSDEDDSEDDSDGGPGGASSDEEDDDQEEEADLDLDDSIDKLTSAPIKAGKKKSGTTSRTRKPLADAN